MFRKRTGAPSGQGKDELRHFIGEFRPAEFPESGTPDHPEVTLDKLGERTFIAFATPPTQKSLVGVGGLCGIVAHFPFYVGDELKNAIFLG